jgi:hypothetical protein
MTNLPAIALKEPNKIAWLLLLGVIAGLFIIPSCWTANEKNLNFTGWCISTAKLIEGNGRLYQDGTHLPLSPLPFVVLNALFPSNKAWIDETSANYVCLMITILVMYSVLCRLFPRPVPFLASLTSLAWFLSCRNNLLYNTMPQVFVAWLCLLACQLSFSTSIRSIASLLFLSFVSALCVLAKQSTATGAVLGVCCWLFFSNPCAKAAFGARLITGIILVGIYLVGMVGLTWLLLWLMSSHVNIAGFVHDVVVHGADTKGGSHYILKLLIRSSARILEGIIAVGLIFVIVGGSGARSFWWEILWGEKKASAEIGVRANKPGRRFPSPLVGIFFGTLLCVYALSFLLGTGHSVTVFRKLVHHGLREISQVRVLVHTTLMLLLVWAAVLFWQIHMLRTVPVEDVNRRKSLLGVILISFLSCLFHSLSDPGMNNYLGDQSFQPVLVLCVGAIVLWTVATLDSFQMASISPRLRAVLTSALSCFILALSAYIACDTMDLISSCRMKPVGIDYLRHSRLMTDATGVLELVNRTKNLTSSNNTVLLLPGDPNLEAWFDRPRPTTSCPIVFTDIYSINYVDDDLRRLVMNPPNVIIIGPRTEMQSGYKWSLGTETFISRVKTELLDVDYKLAFSQPFVHLGAGDYFDVYLLSQRK